MYRELLQKFVRDLSTLDKNELTIVTYDKSKHLLCYRQANKLVMAPYLSPFFMAKKGFKIGVLTQSGYNKLLYNLNQLLGSSMLDKEQLVPDIGILGMDWYRYYGTALMPYPTKFISLEFVNITNRFLVWLLCKTYNNNSKIAYTVIMNERKLLRRSYKNEVK